ncbi:MAG: RNase adapter RapZ [Firmicutes bacterium]|nr:RNase adapter RapZ [Bacillota bacterium]
MKVVIVTGLSGAGKTQAINCLEDMGYYCIDNMPPALIGNFIELLDGGVSQGEIEKVALVIDVRAGAFFENVDNIIAGLKKTGSGSKLIFLEASNEVLVRRYNETRRSHPLSDSGNPLKGIEKERKMMEPVRKLADFVIDTSGMKSARLKQEIRSFIEGEEASKNFVINITSFGFKHGVPQEADFVFDVRFIPNPFYVPSLKKLTGNNKKVQNYVLKFQETKDFIETLDKMITNMIPCYIREGKYHLNIAFGCTGGQHRSVTMANVFAERFERDGIHVTLEHRELE